MVSKLPRTLLAILLLVALIGLFFSNLGIINKVDGDYFSSSTTSKCSQLPTLLGKNALKDNNLTVLLNTTRAALENLQRESIAIRQEKEHLERAAQKAQERVERLSSELRKSKNPYKGAKIAVPTGIIEDDFRTGRSCKRIGSVWECRDCTTEGSSSSSWGRCRIMEPHSPCKPWDTREIDEPRPRRSTSHDPHARDNGLRYTLERLPYRGAYQQYPCLELHDCFNMTKCHDTKGPLKVYMYPNFNGDPGGPIANALASQPLSTLVSVVTEPSDACMLIVTSRSFEKKDYAKLVNTPYWNEGQNHFVFRHHWVLDYDWDIFPGKENYHKAALSSANFYQGQLRLGFDIPLYYDHPQSPFSVNDTIYELVRTQIHRPRSLLLSFQGTIKPISPWNHHRWLASAYWSRNDTDVLLSVRCPKEDIGDPITLTAAPHYEYLSGLLNSTFIFCPGGRSPGSWRFGEALAMGGIPVVTTDFLPPFTPEVDWSDCLVKVTEARVVDLPQILGRISKDEIHRRQTRCHDLFQGFIGWMPCPETRKCKGTPWSIDLEGTQFVASMKLWKLRIDNYFVQQDARKQMERDLVAIKS